MHGPVILNLLVFELLIIAFAPIPMPINAFILPIIQLLRLKRKIFAQFLDYCARLAFMRKSAMAIKRTPATCTLAAIHKETT
jgi:hypothetical protein